MKVSIAIGRKGNKYKCLYVGEKASEAIAKMEEQAQGTEEKPAGYDEICVFRRPIHFKKRQILV